MNQGEGSSNGRTPGSEPGYRGSNPCPAAKKPEHPFWGGPVFLNGRMSKGRLFLTKQQDFECTPGDVGGPTMRFESSGLPAGAKFLQGGLEGWKIKPPAVLRQLDNIQVPTATSLVWQLQGRPGGQGKINKIQESLLRFGHEIGGGPFLSRFISPDQVGGR